MVGGSLMSSAQAKPTIQPTEEHSFDPVVSAQQNPALLGRIPSFTPIHYGETTTMLSTPKTVSLPGSAKPQRSKFREDLDGPLIDPTATPTAKAKDPLPTETPETTSSSAMVLRPSQFSWSSWFSESSKSSASAAPEEQKPSLMKKLKEGVGKLLRLGGKRSPVEKRDESR